MSLPLSVLAVLPLPLGPCAAGFQSGQILPRRASLLDARKSRTPRQSCCEMFSVKRLITWGRQNRWKHWCRMSRR